MRKTVLLEICCAILLICLGLLGQCDGKLKKSTSIRVATLQTHPEQIHLSYGGKILNMPSYITDFIVFFTQISRKITFITLHTAKPDQMIVTWVTLDYVNESFVEYGLKALDQRAAGYQTNFTDGGNEHRTLTIHRVLLSNLTFGQQYSI
jgi:hypothetical protein